jgi:hypothetical protein
MDIEKKNVLSSRKPASNQGDDNVTKFNSIKNFDTVTILYIYIYIYIYIRFILYFI